MNKYAITYTTAPESIPAHLEVIAPDVKTAIEQATANFDKFSSLLITDCGAASEKESLLAKAKRLISKFCNDEYGYRADFSDLTNIDIAYTSVSNSLDEYYDVQVTVDLINYRLITKVDGVVRQSDEYANLETFIDDCLEYLSFDDLVSVADYYLLPGNVCVRECYASADDITFIMHDTYTDTSHDEIVSSRVTGYYYGEPDLGKTTVYMYDLGPTVKK